MGYTQKNCYHSIWNIFNQQVSIRGNRIYHQNNYPLWVTDKIFKEVKENHKVIQMNNDESGDGKHRSEQPYKGDKGTNILRSMEKYVRKLIPKKSTLQITHTGKKN